MAANAELVSQYKKVRQQSLNLCENLSPEDMTAQSMTDASPTKWHLAHTSWFFETFILLKYPAYQVFNPQFQSLFNSYYESVGEQYSRPRRGLITRPGVQEVFAYRQHVDQAMEEVLAEATTEISNLLTVGLHHEMQHQELMLSDLLHLFAQNPLFPAAIASKASELKDRTEMLASPDLYWLEHDGGSIEVGGEEHEFSYDCERPKHKTWLRPFLLASRPLTNGDWFEFMADGGYDNTLLWLSDGWAQKQKQAWQAPAYWVKKEEQWYQFGLDGLKAVDRHSPVCHVSYYEAQAYAQWAGKRLPLEHELELFSQAHAISGNFLESGLWRPQRNQGEQGIQQLYGDVWEWTQSAYLPYPHFKAERGSLGEYNGKFMCGQFVLRGGSCVTPQMQMRPSYRNFFYPHQRWQFTGVRLADDR